MVYITGCKRKLIVQLNDGEKITEVEVLKGTSLDVSIPTKEGHTFLYWELDGKKYNINAEIKENITLYAKWEVNKYTVTFGNTGDSLIEDKTKERERALREVELGIITKNEYRAKYYSDLGDIVEPKN